MTRRIGKVLVIAHEKARQCQLCGKVAETRPYGPRGERICFECGMKNEAETKRQFKRLLDGDKDS